MVVEPVQGDVAEERTRRNAETRERRSSCSIPVAYFARHGETESNLLGRYAGHNSEPLTDAGRSQMSGLAAQLGLLGIKEVWTSEVARARESAELVGDVLGIPVRADPRLNELRMGPWEGLTEAQVADRFPDAYGLWCTLPDRVALDGRETLDELAARVTAAVHDAVRQPHSVLLMTHVAPIRVAVLASLGLPLRFYRQVRVTNGACMAVDHDKREVRRLGASECIKDEISLAGPESSVA